MPALGVLEVYEAGELTVVGFGGREIIDSVSVADCRDELQELISEHGCRSLALDLTGVRIVPSGLLGLLASVHQKGVEVHLYNANDDVREVLEITQLDRVLHLHEVEVE
jgi:anti-sigma B factor antagonist